MRFVSPRISGLVGLAFLLSSCESEQVLAPTAETSFSTTGGTSKLGAPSSLSATTTATNRIRLTWQDNSTNENGFEVLRSLTGLPGSFSGYAETGAGVANYEDAGVEPSTRYCYAVRAFKVAGRNKSYSALTSSVCITTPVAPGAPATPTGTAAVSANSSTITVNWADNSEDETGFRIERAPISSGPWESAGEIGKDLRSFSDGARTSEAQVCYRVAAFNANGSSLWSEGTACAIPPAGPTDLRSAEASLTAIDLAWTDNSALEEGYEIQRATAGDGPYTVIVDLSSNVTSYRDDGLASDQPYWYRVRAKRAGGFSDFSAPTATILATSPPAAPTWVSASPFNGWSTFLVWNDNSTNEAGFRLERSDGGAPWVTLMTFGPGSGGGAVWDDKNFPQELEICYRVIAYNGLGESSDTGCTALPAVPVDLSARIVEGVVELSWTDISNFEDGYYIVRADGMSMGFYYVYDAVGPNATSYRDMSPDPEWSSYYLRAMKGPEGYSCCSNAVDVVMPPGGSP